MTNADYKRIAKIAYWVLLGWEVWILKISWAALKFAGRVLLWFLCWPIGMWRSITHRGDKRTDKMLAAMAKASRQG